jgi:hypothetical protein
MIQIAYGQSAVVSGWIVAPMAITEIFSCRSGRHRNLAVLLR